MGTDDDPRTGTRTTWRHTAPGAALTAGTAAAMTAVVDLLLPAALGGHGETGLMAWILVTVAAAGALLCTYLAVIWTLATAALVAGPASRTGMTVIAALRVLAPRLARRLTVTAAVATTATGLVLVPAGAATSPDPGPGSTRFTMSAAEQGQGPAPAELPGQEGSGPSDDGGRPAPAPPRAGGQSSSPGAPLPSLGWEGTADPAPEADDRPSSGAGEDTSSDAAESSPVPDGDQVLTVTVAPGDTLWSITDTLLGPEPDDPSRITAAWPLLHDANRGLIGPDPDCIAPGQVLTVPAPLAPQEQS